MLERYITSIEEIALSMKLTFRLTKWKCSIPTATFANCYIPYNICYFWTMMTYQMVVIFGRYYGKGLFIFLITIIIWYKSKKKLVLQKLQLVLNPHSRGQTMRLNIVLVYLVCQSTYTTLRYVCKALLVLRTIIT